MGYRVLLSESTDRDLDSILTYIADTLANPKAANDFVNALEDRFVELEAHPLMFEASRNEGLAEISCCFLTPLRYGCFSSTIISVMSLDGWQEGS